MSILLDHLTLKRDVLDFKARLANIAGRWCQGGHEDGTALPSEWHCACPDCPSLVMAAKEILAALNEFPC